MCCVNALWTRQELNLYSLICVREGYSLLSSPMLSTSTKHSLLFEYSLVPEVGLEPTRPFGHYDLNVARLPIPPPGQ